MIQYSRVSYQNIKTDRAESKKSSWQGAVRGFIDNAPS